MKELYERYGQLMIQLEILQNKIGECKKKIADELNKKSIKPEKEPAEK